MSRWIQSFKVPSTSRPRTTYVVSLDREGHFGCSCPQWKYRRADCRHILSIREQVQDGPRSFRPVNPTCVPANVPEVHRHDADTVLVPLLPIGNAHFVATVVVDLLLHGVEFYEIKHRYHLTPTARRQDYIEHVLRHARHTYGPHIPGQSRRTIEITEMDFLRRIRRTYRMLL